MGDGLFLSKTVGLIKTLASILDYLNEARVYNLQQFLVKSRGPPTQ